MKPTRPIRFGPRQPALAGVCETGATASHAESNAGAESCRAWSDGMRVHDCPISMRRCIWCRCRAALQWRCRPLRPACLSVAAPLDVGRGRLRSTKRRWMWHIGNGGREQSAHDAIMCTRVQRRVQRDQRVRRASTRHDGHWRCCSHRAQPHPCCVLTSLTAALSLRALTHMHRTTHTARLATRDTATAGAPTERSTAS